MALLRPSLTLVLHVDERIASQETILEIRRCYTYIGTPVIRPCAPTSDDAPLHSYAQLMVGLGTRRYLYSADAGADDLWEEVVARWIGNMLHKIGSTMRAFNIRQPKINLPEVVFERIDVELQGGAFVVGLHTDPQSFIDFEASEYVNKARALLNAGVFQDAVRVDVPSDEHYQQQYDELYSAWQAEHPEAEKQDAQQTSKPEACDATAEPERELTREEWLELDRQAKSYENTAVAPTDSNELPSVQREEEAPEPERFTFEVDCSQWDVQFADGSHRTFDAVNDCFCDQDN